MLGLYGDNGKENGSYYILYWGSATTNLSVIIIAIIHAFIHILIIQPLLPTAVQLSRKGSFSISGSRSGVIV